MPSSKKAAAAAAGAAGAPPAAGSNAARRSAAAAAAATGAGLQVAPADGTGSLPNLKPRGQGRWQVFLCAQGLKYLYVGQYENLPDAKHARDLAVLAVHGPKLVPTLEPVSNYSEGDIAAVRAQMAEKPAARAVMVANGLWPPEGMAGDAALHQPQQPRSRRLPGLQHTLQMIREEHKERMQQQQQQQQQLQLANPTGTTGIREHKGVFEVFLATPPFKYLYVGRANSLYEARRMKATAMMAIYGSMLAVEQFGAEPHAVTEEDVRYMAVKLSAKPAALAAMRQYGTDALLTAAEAEAAAAAQRRAGPAAQQQLAQVQLQLQVQAQQAAAAAAAAAEHYAAAAAAAAVAPFAEPSSSSRTSADGEACVSICTRRSMIAKDGRLGSHSTGRLGVRTHKGGYEAFIATPPFKYLYVGLYRTVQAAVQARDTAMLVVYGKEAAAALGVPEAGKGGTPSSGCLQMRQRGSSVLG
ncbi:hypothetical protein OEZ86_003677 [Tetradesmus obliquus]|nr:hypothetical protein OEZ86_003677 [Tetradesmus obliquus]